MTGYKNQTKKIEIGIIQTQEEDVTIVLLQSLQSKSHDSPLPDTLLHADSGIRRGTGKQFSTLILTTYSIPEWPEL